jgi:biopolymer transport protein TolQ
VTWGILAQVGGATPTSSWELLLSTDAVTKAVLVFLALLSLVSWTIVLAKWREFSRVKRASRIFMEGFSGATSLADVASLARKGGASPFAQVLVRAERFMADTRPAMAATPDRSARFSASQVEALRLVLDSQAEAERDALAHYVPWLATIGSASPLIGLFGTVLGIIQSFVGIATTGSGNVASVAPGVAAALTATAAALAVAIPAVFAYNIFANRLNRIEGELEGFGSELIAMLVREDRI